MRINNKDQKILLIEFNFMMKKLILSSIAVTAILGANAQLNSTSIEGFYDRALYLYQDKNYQGCIDQMSQLLEMNPSIQQKEVAEYFIAKSALLQGDKNAIVELNNFLKNYPASLYRMNVMASIGDYYFANHNYAKALEEYMKVEPDALEESNAIDYAYRKAYAQLKLGNNLEAAQGFKPLLNSAKYGNSAKFYTGYIAYVNKDYPAALDFFNQVKSDSELGDMSSYYKSQIYYLRHDYAKALPLARKMLTKNVDATYMAEANRIVGESLYHQGDIVAAIPYLQQYVANAESPLASTRYILGACQYKNQDYSKAIETLESVTREDNAMGQSAYLIIGQSLLKQNDTHAAMMALDKAIKMDHNLEIQEVAFYNYAVASLKGGSIPFGNSVENFEEFLRRYPNSQYVPKVQEYIVTGYMTDNNYDRAYRSIERIANPSDAILKAKQRVLYSLATRNMSNGDIDGALALFNESKALGRFDKELSTETDLWLGDCYYAKGEYDNAADKYLDYAEASSDDAENLSLAYYNLGYARMKSQRYDDAITNFENALDDTSTLKKEVVADAYSRIGDCYYYLSDFSSAIKNYDKAHKASPETGDYAVFLKAMMSGYRRDYSAKVNTLNEVLEQYPSSGIIPSVLLQKAECYIEQHEYSKAIESYKQLVKNYPTTTQGRNGYLQLAIAYLNSHKKNEAIEAYKSVITNYPTSDEARVASQDLMRIYAEDNMLETYTAFMATVPGALPVEKSELEEAAFTAAEGAYLAGKGEQQLKSYVKQYKGGVHEPAALALLAECEYNNGNEKEALKYAAEVINRFPDNSAVESALSVKAEIEYNKGDIKGALNDYRKLEAHASSANMLTEARAGILRATYDLAQYDETAIVADKLLASPISSELKSEVLFKKATSLGNRGKSTEAIEIWTAQSEDVEDLYGAMSAIELGQHYYDKGQLVEARQVVETFVNSSSPYQYWVARGFILLSDINRKEGKIFEANEYLRTLRENYPNSDADIFKMIDERLK